MRTLAHYLRTEASVGHARLKHHEITSGGAREAYKSANRPNSADFRPPLTALYQRASDPFRKPLLGAARCAMVASLRSLR